MQSDAKQLDTQIEIVTPENIAFQYRVAGPFRRLPAYLIDLAVRAGVAAVAFGVLVFAFGMAGLASLGFGVWLTLAFLLTWFYGGVFETFYNGQTPGKRLMRIRVLSVDGRAVNALQATLRNVLRTVDGQPGLFYLLGLAVATMNDRFQRLGDLACGTMVVVEERQWYGDVVRVDDPRAIRLAAELPAGFQPSRSLARALATYVGRRENFSPSRRAQLARHLGVPLRHILDLPPETDFDRLLCALYHRTFITDQEEPPGSEPISPMVAFDKSAGGNPFASSTTETTEVVNEDLSEPRTEQPFGVR
ncbi:MAG: RDD family protein [Planctomycetia bacterium]|nr:RDD family protein [Planctomycetia bacterium]